MKRDIAESSNYEQEGLSNRDQSHSVLDQSWQLQPLPLELKLTQTTECHSKLQMVTLHLLLAFALAPPLHLAAESLYSI